MKTGFWVLCALALAVSPVAAADNVPGGEVLLFNGKDLEGWRGLGGPNNWTTAGHVSLGTKDKTLFSIEAGEGVMVNDYDGRTVNLVSEYLHGDCQLHIEFMVPHQSNSGVYFQGLYEIQILDSYGKDHVTFSECGGIYARFKDGETYEGHPPRVNAGNPPGVWQSFDAVFRAPRFGENGNKTENARFVIVKHNGVTVHENVEVTGGTRACMDIPEAPKGPLMLQGDHGPVAFRNIRLVPLELK